MKNLVGIALMLLASLPTASCQRYDYREKAGICDGAEADHVCLVPFEALYFDREHLMGRNVRLEGVLIVGATPEPPGSEEPVMLLFPSMERASICNPQLALELLPASAGIVAELRDAHGTYISATGRLQPSKRGHWSEMQITRPVSPISSAKGDFYCMSVPPPPPPEPPPEELVIDQESGPEVLE